MGESKLELLSTHFDKAVVELGQEMEALRLAFETTRTALIDAIASEQLLAPDRQERNLHCSASTDDFIQPTQTAVADNSNNDTAAGGGNTVTSAALPAEAAASLPPSAPIS